MLEHMQSVEMLINWMLTARRLVEDSKIRLDVVALSFDSAGSPPRASLTSPMDIYQEDLLRMSTKSRLRGLVLHHIKELMVYQRPTKGLPRADYKHLLKKNIIRAFLTPF